MTTYEFPGKEDVRISVGDEKQQDFFPRMKIKRWDNEVNFSVGIISTFQGSHDKVGDKVAWNDGHGIGARFYEKLDDQFEFEIILDEKPKSGFVLLSIETKGLRFLYQPELTKEEIDDGCERPADVVGSYAVYHESMKGDYSKRGDNNYRAGKAFHIYRPFVTDANGKREWCEMDITGTVMKITIPDGLVYPVVIDPTFGVDPASPGGSVTGYNGDTLQGSLFTSPSGADKAESITAYCAAGYTSPYGTYFKGVIVLHSNLNIVTDGVGAATALPSPIGWSTSDLTSDPDISVSTGYVLMFIANGSCRINYDQGGADQSHYDTSNSYASPINPTDATHSTAELSIYCTYTAVSAKVVYQNKSETKIDTDNTNCTISAPTGFDAGDLLIAVVIKDGNINPTVPAGWTSIQDGYNQGVGVNCSWRIAQTGDTSWTWTSAAGERWFGTILRYKGHDPTTPIHAEGGASGADAAPTAPTIAYTDVEVGSIALQVFGADDDDTPYTTPAALTERFNDVSGGFSTCGGAGGEKIIFGTGSTGTAVFSMNASEGWVAETIVIEAAVVVGSPMWYYNMLRRRNS